MIIAYAGNQTILPTRLAKNLPGGVRQRFRVIWHSQVEGKFLYVHVPDIPSMANFAVTDCNWSKADDKGWYQGEITDD